MEVTYYLEEKILGIFEVTKSFEPMCKMMCTEEEYLQMKKAFFEKEQNLKKYLIELPGGVRLV